MQEQLDAWSRGSHHAVAVCNDCHAPHEFVGKYATKAINGWNHSLAFTTGRFHEPIQITSLNRRVTESACRHCHGEIVTAMAAEHRGQRGEVACLRCHGSVGHSELSPVAVHVEE
jgi:cytochrome c nitrite reductase small subunit